MRKGPASWLPLRFALREMRSGLRGFYVFIICIALGTMAIAGVGALAPNPAILVADEPTGNLDEDTGRQIIDLLFAGHAQRGTTLVLVTHDTGLAARCGRVVRLRSGRVEAGQ